MSSERPTRRFVLPPGLKGVENGKIPNDLLVAIRPSGRLYHSAATAWQLMRKAARADGVTQLRPTSTYDTYRPYTIQKAVFLQRYVREPVSKNVRRWDGQVWYLKPGLAPLASPGTSIHGFACAVDIWNVGQNGRLEWLTDNAARFGFYWERGVEKSEPWHLIYTLGEKTP